MAEKNNEMLPENNSETRKKIILSEEQADIYRQHDELNNQLMDASDEGDDELYDKINTKLESFLEKYGETIDELDALRKDADLYDSDGNLVRSKLLSSVNFEN